MLEEDIAECRKHLGRIFVFILFSLASHALSLSSYRGKVNPTLG